MVPRADPCRQLNSRLIPGVGQMPGVDPSRQHKTQARQEQDNPYQLQSKLNTKLLIVQNNYLHVAMNYTKPSLVNQPNYLYVIHV